MRETAKSLLSDAQRLEKLLDGQRDSELFKRPEIAFNSPTSPFPNMYIDEDGDTYFDLDQEEQDMLDHIEQSVGNQSSLNIKQAMENK